jgi:hypothetical protein
MIMDSSTGAESQEPGISEIELCEWLGQAGTGDTLVYHRGSLAHDRSQSTSRLSRQDRNELAKVASRALAVAEAGLADLAQRRFGPGRYEYMIIVRPRPRANGGLLVRVLATELGQPA